MKYISIIFLMIIIPATFVNAKVIYVPDDYQSIQEAINIAVDNDVILVRPGEYLERINFLGKKITVKSTKGAGDCYGGFTTIIKDPLETAPIITFNSGEDRNSVLDGFTILSNGEKNLGIYLSNTSPVIKNNIFSAFNGSETIIHIENSSPLFANNTFCPNSNFEISKGAIYVSGGRPEIIGNSFLYILSYENAAGIYCDSGSPLIKFNFFDKNENGSGTLETCIGGAIFIKDPCTAVISSNEFKEDVACRGSAIAISNAASVTIDNNLIYDNRTEKGGAINIDSATDIKVMNNYILNNNRRGIMVRDTNDIQIFNNVIAGNEEKNNGGGIYSWGSTPTIYNNTIVNNTAGGKGGGMFIGRSSSAQLINNIIYYNSASEGSNLYVDSEDGSTATVSYCDIEGGWSGVGNIDSPPLFADPEGGDGVVGTLDDEYHLRRLSPCIDAGDGDIAPLKDKEGYLRHDSKYVDNTGVGEPNFSDIGAYEWSPFCVDVSNGLDELCLYKGTCSCNEEATYRDYISGYVHNLSDNGVNIDLGTTICLGNNESSCLEEGLRPYVGYCRFYLVKDESDINYGYSSDHKERKASEDECE